MTQYVYIASPNKLSQGSFGLRPVSFAQPNIFDRELDFVHLYFENNYDEKLKQRFSYSPHFSFNYQVATYSNHMPLTLDIQGTAEERKVLDILYAYLEKAVQSSGVVEYFTSLEGKQDADVSSQREVRWNEIQTSYDLLLNDREFWVITQ